MTRSSCVVRLACAALTLFALSACAAGTWRRDALRSAPALALVDLCVDPRVRYVPGTGEVLDAPIRATTDRIAAAATDELRAALAGDHGYRLVADAEVLSSPAYVRASDEPAEAAGACRRAPGYRIVRDPAAMARALPFDGVMVASIRFGYVVDGVNLAGAWAFGTVRGRAVVRLTAVDQDGRSVWVDRIVTTSDGSFLGVSEGFDAARLDPLMAEAARAAVRVLLERFDAHR